MAKEKEPEKLECRYCKRKGIEKEFKNLQGLRAHERNTHKVHRRNGKRLGETVVQEPICYCPFCGKQLPNATIIKG